ncbi:hypothetical protein B0H19DRAFT_1316502 [Mycena capillaripes]|nr:hypothetical protein B0H19DRAFT_1316502 [Mycena capillaripes]
MSSEGFVFEPLRDSYYLETVVFNVENAFFKVPRFQFERHSGIFATTLSLPQPVEGAEGTNDKIPFKLDGIKRADFQALLKVLYPIAIPKLPELKREEWISVLHLASLWDFIEVRDLAVQQLSLTLNATERIVLGRKHDVSSWLRSGYTELAKRKTPISSEEAAKIGWEVTLQICQLREAAVAPEAALKTRTRALASGRHFRPSSNGQTRRTDRYGPCLGFRQQRALFPALAPPRLRRELSLILFFFFLRS